MKLKTETRPLFKETMMGMKVGEMFTVSALKENSVKPIASNLRKIGFDFKITRKGDIIEVACLKKPEQPNKEEEE